MSYKHTPHQYNTVVVTLKDASAVRVPYDEMLSRFSLTTLDSLCSFLKRKDGGTVFIRRAGGRKFFVIFSPNPGYGIDACIELLGANEHVEKVERFLEIWSGGRRVVSPESETAPPFSPPFSID